MNRFLIFFAVFGTVLLTGYLYIAMRISQSFQISGIPKFALFTFLGILAVLTPASYGLSFYEVDPAKEKTLVLIAFSSFGFFTIAVSLFAGFDILSWILSKTPFLENTFSGTKELHQDYQISRKEMFDQFFRTSALVLSAGLAGYGLKKVSDGPKVYTVKIPLEGLPDSLKGFRIVQISDVHIGPTLKKDFAKEITEKVNSLSPDMIAITGDLVDGSVERLRNEVIPFADLNSKYGTFFCTGNHEYFSGALSWIHFLKSIGIKVLMNSNEIISHNGYNIMVAGIPDPVGGGAHPDHRIHMQKTCRTDRDCTVRILLAHQPKQVVHAVESGFHLQLSGHTHGGQYFPGTPLIYLVQKYVKGLHKVEDTWLYVNRGTGYWGPPFRTVDQEITVIELI
ncbi:MAG TPA: metallophosphoesterase [Leptospiraceae bacterium]|nr:metallophosphoesterase [Leptospiraceae bacterium]